MLLLLRRLLRLEGTPPHRLSLFRRERRVLPGQGAWEDQLLEGTRRLDGVLRAKGIHAWVDYWGTDCDHDWPWWKKQMRYFLPHVVGRP